MLILPMPEDMNTWQFVYNANTRYSVYIQIVATFKPRVHHFFDPDPLLNICLFTKPQKNIKSPV